MGNQGDVTAIDEIQLGTTGYERSGDFEQALLEQVIIDVGIEEATSFGDRRVR